MPSTVALRLALCRHGHLDAFRALVGEDSRLSRLWWKLPNVKLYRRNGQLDARQAHTNVPAKRELNRADNQHQLAMSLRGSWLPSQHWLAKTLVEQAANDKLCRLLRKMRSNLGLDKVPKVKLCRRTRLDSRMPSKQAINTNEAAGYFRACICLPNSG